MRIFVAIVFATSANGDSLGLGISTWGFTRWQNDAPWSPTPSKHENVADSAAAAPRPTLVLETMSGPAQNKCTELASVDGASAATNSYASSSLQVCGAAALHFGQRHSRARRGGRCEGIKSRGGWTLASHCSSRVRRRPSITSLPSPTKPMDTRARQPLWVGPCRRCQRSLRPVCAHACSQAPLLPQV